METFPPKHAASGSSWGFQHFWHVPVSKTGILKVILFSGLSLEGSGLSLGLLSLASWGQKLGRSCRPCTGPGPPPWDMREGRRHSRAPAPGMLLTLGVPLQIWGNFLSNNSTETTGFPGNQVSCPGTGWRGPQGDEGLKSRSERDCWDTCPKPEEPIGVCPKGMMPVCFAEGISYITSRFVSVVSWPSMVHLRSHLWVIFVSFHRSCPTNLQDPQLFSWHILCISFGLFVYM